MSDLFYRAHSLYQYSYIWKIYQNLGGKFILTNKKDFKKLQHHVGNEHCVLLDQTHYLPPKTSGFVFEMSLSRHWYLKRKRNSEWKNVLIHHAMGSDETLKKRRFPITRYDYYFISGEKDYLRFKHNSYGMRSFDKRVVKIGHLRSDYILNKEYNVDKIINFLGITDRTRKNILYTPTWSYGEGTLLKTYKVFCTQISQKYNLLIRTHPYDLKNYKLVQKFIEENHIKNVYLIDSNKIDIIDNLAVADLLIGENSSVMYDWLFFNRPVILVKTPGKILEKASWAQQRRFSVGTCGFLYNIEEKNINKLIDESLAHHPFKNQIEFVKNNTFYYNDGKATERAVQWIRDTINTNWNR